MDKTSTWKPIPAFEHYVHRIINNRAFLHTRYKHERAGEIINNVVYGRKDEMSLLLWR